MDIAATRMFEKGLRSSPILAPSPSIVNELTFALETESRRGGRQQVAVTLAQVSLTPGCERGNVKCTTFAGQWPAANLRGRSTRILLNLSCYRDAIPTSFQNGAVSPHASRVRGSVRCVRLAVVVGRSAWQLRRLCLRGKPVASVGNGAANDGE